MSVEKLLKTRKEHYGDFATLAGVSQKFKDILHSIPNWNELPADMQESLEMIVHKVSRIGNGNFNYSDSWEDIAGYAQLVVNRLRKEDRE